MKQRIYLAFAVILMALLTACGGPSLTVKKPYKPGDKDKISYVFTDHNKLSFEAKNIFVSRLTSQFGAEGLLSTEEAANKSVEIIVTNYYMRHGAARALGGIFAGTDNLRTTVIIKDKVTKGVLAEFVVESSNASAWGTTQGFLENHADKIVAYLKKGS